MRLNFKRYWDTRSLNNNTCYFHVRNKGVERFLMDNILFLWKKNGKRKVLGVPQSQTAARPRHQEEEKTDTSNLYQNSNYLRFFIYLFVTIYGFYKYD